MTDLAAFLAARLDEDEAAIKVNGGWWKVTSTAVGVYEGRQDSARTLREVEAKRAILAEHGPGRRDATRCRVCTAIVDNHATRFRAPCPTLRRLAAVYDEHPDYQHSLWEVPGAASDEVIVHDLDWAQRTSQERPAP